MLFMGSLWIGCSSSNDGPGTGGAQTCKGSPGAEFCPCNASGGCDTGLTCAIDILQCVHIAGGMQTATGGTSGSGNSTGAGDTTGAGNGTGTGGVTNSGGSAGSHVSGSGGVIGSGGSGGGRVTGGGGMTSSGGSAGGRATGVGGMSSSGGGTGTGGVTATSCSNLTPAANGNGQFTYYYFGQGTYMTGGKYQTACGYTGTESGQTDMVANIANSGMAKNSYFAAIPGTNGFNSKGSCGTCVQISNGGHTIIATIIDECPYGGDGNNAPCQANPTGELDLSKSAFDALGFSTGNPSGTSWKAVPCPVTGNVVVRIKSGNQNEAYIENTILAIKSVSGPGGNASRQSYGAWHFNGNLGSGSQLTLTDAADRMIQVTLNSGSMNQDQDTGKQFPACQ